MFLAVFDACQVLTWKGRNGGPGHEAIMSSKPGLHPEGLLYGLGPEVGGWEASTTVAGPALGCGFLGG